MWAALEEYLKEIGAENTGSKKRWFGVVYMMHTILGALLALVMLRDGKLRIALYVIMTLIAINAFLVQICKNGAKQGLVLPVSPAEGEKQKTSDDEPIIKVRGVRNS